MAHIICITGGLTGIFNASLGLVQHLERAGHQITYASPYDLHKPVIAKGIPYIQLEPWGMRPIEPSTLNWWQKLRLLPERQQHAVDAMGVQNFVKTIKDLKPDLLLIDMEMYPYIMSAVAAQLPVALLCPFLSIWKRPNLPPINTSIVPGEGWQGNGWGIEWSWFRNGLTRWVQYQKARLRRVGLVQRSILRCHAQQLDISFRQQFGFTQWLIPYDQGLTPILCFHALELDFPHNPHPLMHYVGPMISEDRPESWVEPMTYQALEKLYEHRRSHHRSLIYCGCSTFVQGDTQHLQKIIAAVANVPQWDLVLGLGGKLDLETLGPLPTNVHAFRWAPQLQILKHADCAVIDGGINTINECIYFGVPMLVYSLGHACQNGSTARVAYHKLGLVGDRLQDNASQILCYLQQLLTGVSYQVTIDRMRDIFHQYSHENRAAQVVERLLTTKSQCSED